VTKHTTPAAGNLAASTGKASQDYTPSEGLRALLIRLHEAGPGAWQHDREAAALMRHTARKYLPLARKHGLDVWDVASFAFDAMRTGSVRGAGDPWAVLTRAVQITCISEVRAAGLLISTQKARRTGRLGGFHDAVRFADREHLADWHPAFAVTPFTDDATDADPGDDGTDSDLGDGAGRVAVALSGVVGLFVAAGWEPVLARDVVADVVLRLGDYSTRSSAVEVLRQERQVPARLGLPQRSWTAVLRIVLGHPDPKHAGTSTGDGVLLRLLNGEPLNVLRDDPRLVAAIRAANPHKHPAPQTADGPRRRAQARIR
jgi:hypothetical protein